MSTVPPENRRAAGAIEYISYAGIAVMAAGLVGIFCGFGDWLAVLGIGLLVIGPIAGLISVLVTFVQKKDWKWAGVASVLAVILALTMVLSYYF